MQLESHSQSRNKGRKGSSRSAAILRVLKGHTSQRSQLYRGPQTCKNQLEETGTLYYFEEYVPELDFWQAKNEIRTEMPSGQNFRSVSEAMVDFSGVSVKIGFIVRF